MKKAFKKLIGPDLNEVRKLMMSKGFATSKELVQKSLRLLNELDKTYKENDEIYNLRGEIFLLVGIEKGGDKELLIKANTLASQSLQINSDYTPAKLTFARTLLELKDYNGALKSVEKILKGNRSNFDYEAYLILNKIYRATSNFVGLRYSLNETLKIKETAEVYYQLAVIENHFAAHEKAMTLLSKAIIIFNKREEKNLEDCIAVYALRAEVFNNLENYKKAAKDAEEALRLGLENEDVQLSPDYKKAYLERAWANYYLEENHLQVISDMRASGVLENGNKQFTNRKKINCHFLIGKLYLQFNNLEKALERANSLFELAKSMQDNGLTESYGTELLATYYLKQATIDFKQGRFDAVIEIASKMLKPDQKTNRGEFFALRARAHLKQENFDLAMKDAKAGIYACQNKDAEIYFCLAEAQFERKEFAKAELTLKCIDNNISGSKITKRIHLLTAIQYFKHFKDSESENLLVALNNANKVIKLDNKCIPALEVRTKIYHLLGKPEEALQDQAEIYFLSDRKTKMFPLFDIAKFYIVRNEQRVKTNLWRVTESNLVGLQDILTRSSITKNNLAITLSEYISNRKTEEMKQRLFKDQKEILKLQKKNLKTEAALLKDLMKKLNSSEVSISEVEATLFARHQERKAALNKQLTLNPAQTPQGLHV